MSLPLIVLAGPTCVGKTSVGIALAQRLGAEIVSADSRQIYRYMDIGTAKPTRYEQEAVRHHLIDIVEPDRRFSAGAYAAAARGVIENIKRRGRTPLIVGGAGLYLQALAGGLFNAPDISQEMSEAIRARLAALSTGTLYEILQRVDPEAATRIHGHDRQRIIRGLEVYEATGIPLTTWQRSAMSQPPGMSMRMIGLDRPRAVLYRRIDARVDAMMETGLIQEVEQLVKRGYTGDTWALKTFGYAEIWSYLQGELALETAIDEIKKQTRRYAKRQLTWFRHREGIVWEPVGEGDTPEQVADRILHLVARREISGEEG